MRLKKESLALAAVVAIVSCTLVAPPAFAAAPDSDAQTLTLSKAQTTSVDPAQAARLDQLIAAYDRSTGVFDAAKVSAATLSSADGKAFVSTLTAEGAHMASDSVGTHLPAVAMRAAKKKTGKLWIDAWGVHIKAPAPVISALSAAAAGAGGSAAAVAGILLVNVEGFPISTGGAITSGAVAAGLFAASGILALCNLNGRGAQLNYNWVTWTCWPL